MWLALASSAACVGGLAVTAACAPHTASADAQEAGPSCAVAEGRFPCGSETCDRLTQYCSSSAGNTCTSYVEAGSCASKIDAGFPAECLGCPTCACVRTHLPPDVHQPPDYWSTSACIDEAEGGVEIHQQFYSCGPCYGAPPARLERLAAA